MTLLTLNPLKSKFYVINLSKSAIRGCKTYKSLHTIRTLGASNQILCTTPMIMILNQEKK